VGGVLVGGGVRGRAGGGVGGGRGWGGGVSNNKKNIGGFPDLT